ncbi:Trehalose utilization [compost metagenome]
MKKNLMMIIGLIISISHAIVHAQQLRILNFYGDSGFRHLSQPVAVDMIEKICTRNNWEYVSTKRTAIFNPRDLATFDVVVFNNNCGNEGQIFNEEQQEAFRSFIHGGGGFVGIHCAGAIWNEGKDFQ